MKTLRAHGFAAGYEHASRRVIVGDLMAFDHLLAMDRHNLQALQRKRRAWQSKGSAGSAVATEDRISLFSAFDGETVEEVGDPYYGEHDGFEEAFEQCVRFSQGWIRRLLGWDVDVDAKGMVTATKVSP